MDTLLALPVARQRWPEDHGPRAAGRGPRAAGYSPTTVRYSHRHFVDNIVLRLGQNGECGSAFRMPTSTEYRQRLGMLAIVYIIKMPWMRVGGMILLSRSQPRMEKIQHAGEHIAIVTDVLKAQQ